MVTTKLYSHFILSLDMELAILKTFANRVSYFIGTGDQNSHLFSECFTKPFQFTVPL